MKANIVGEKIKGIITDIQRFSVHDGNGIRTIVFLKGCPLRCLWCHNPETNHVAPEIAYYREKCIECGICREVCPQHSIDETGVIDRALCDACGSCTHVCCTKARVLMGQERTVEEVIQEVEKDIVFYHTSGGGLTLSGGEPTAQPKFAAALMKSAKKRGIGTALETCGYCSWEKFQPILESTDMVLYDVKHPDPQRHKEGTGVDNLLILENLKRIKTVGVRLIIRFPLIPDFNNDDTSINGVGRLAVESGAEEIHVLPFHQVGQQKWDALNRSYAYESVALLTQDEILHAKALLEQTGLPVNLGGYGEYQI